MPSSSSPTAPIIRKLEHDLRNALALAHILPRLLETSHLDPTSLTPTPNISYPLFEPTSIDPPPIFSAIQLSVWDNITGPRTEAIWTAGGHSSSETSPSEFSSKPNHDSKPILSERIRKAICRRTVDAFEPEAEKANSFPIPTEPGKPVDKALIASLSFPYDRKFNVFPDLDHFVSTCLFVAPLHGHASKFALSLIVSIQYLPIFSKGNILKGISEQLMFLSSIIQRLYILAHRRDILKDTELKLPALRVALPKAPLEKFPNSPPNKSAPSSPSKGNPQGQGNTQNLPLSSTGSKTASGSSPLGGWKRFGQSIQTTMNRSKRQTTPPQQQRKKGRPETKQKRPSLQLPSQDSSSGAGAGAGAGSGGQLTTSQRFGNSTLESSFSTGLAGLSNNSDSFSPLMSPETSPRGNSNPPVFHHPPHTPIKDRSNLTELSPPSSLPTSPRTPASTYDYLFSPAPSNVSFSKISTSQTVRFMPGFGQFIIRFILNIYSLFCLHTAPSQPHHITSFIPLCEPANIAQFQHIFSCSFFDMIESQSSVGSVHSKFISNNVVSSIGSRIPGGSLIPRNITNISFSDTSSSSTTPTTPFNHQKRRRHLFAQPNSLASDSPWFDFIARAITSHLQTMGRSVVIGSDPDMVESLVITLSFFSHPSDYPQSIGAYEIARNQHTNPPTFRPRRTYSDVFVLQGLVYPPEKKILHLHERMALFPGSPTTWIDIDALSVRHTPLFARYNRIRNRMISHQLYQISMSTTFSTSAALRFEQIVSKYEKTSSKFAQQSREDAIKRALAQTSTGDPRMQMPIDTTGDVMEVGIHVEQVEDDAPSNETPKKHISHDDSRIASSSTSSKRQKRVSVQDLEKITVFFEKSRKSWYRYLNRAAKSASEFSCQFSTISPSFFYSQKSQVQDEDPTFSSFEQDLGPEFLSESELSEISRHQELFDDAFQISGGSMKHGVHPFSRKPWFSSKHASGSGSESNTQRGKNRGFPSESISSGHPSTEQLQIQREGLSSFLDKVVSNPRKVNSSKNYSGDAFEIPFANLLGMESDSTEDPDFNLDPSWSISGKSKKKSKKRRKKNRNIPNVVDDVLLPVWKYDDYSARRDAKSKSTKEILPDPVENSVRAFGNVYSSLLYPLPVPSPWVRGVLETVWSLPLDQRLGFIQQTMSILSQAALLLISTTRSMMVSMNGPTPPTSQGDHASQGTHHPEKKTLQLPFNLKSKTDSSPNFGFYGTPVPVVNGAGPFINSSTNVSMHSDFHDSFDSQHPSNRLNTPEGIDGSSTYKSDTKSVIREGDIMIQPKTAKKTTINTRDPNLSIGGAAGRRKGKKATIASTDETAGIPPNIRIAVRRMLNTIPTSFDQMINHPLTTKDQNDHLDAEIQSSRQDWLILLAQAQYIRPGIANWHLGETGPGDGSGIDSFHSIRTTRVNTSKSLVKLFSEF